MDLRLTGGSTLALISDDMEQSHPRDFVMGFLWRNGDLLVDLLEVKLCGFVGAKTRLRFHTLTFWIDLGLHTP